MERCSAYVIVSEGSSERAYIQQVTNNGAGGGQFSLVQQTYRKCRKADKRTPIMVWVDADIYVRNEGVVEEGRTDNDWGMPRDPDGTSSGRQQGGACCFGSGCHIRRGVAELAKQVALGASLDAAF